MLYLNLMSKPGERIAILDDDASVRKALLRLFGTSRYKVTAYASAAEFLAAIEQCIPNCLIADLQMPTMTGFELQSHLGRAGIRIPTIIVTAFDEPDTRERCLAAGASNYLLKPIRMGALMAAVDEAISNIKK